MNSCRHRRIISCDSLKPCMKPGNIQIDTTRLSESPNQYIKVPRTTMNTEHIRGIDQMTYSYSFEENVPGEHQYEKQLFSRFLQATQLQWMAIVSSMNDIKPIQLVNFVKIGDSVEDNYENRLMAHYIGVWLMSMGYFDKQNKARIIQNVQLMFDYHHGAGQVANMMYDSLFHGHLPTDLQMKALLQVCRRGWEYLTFLICRLIKLLKKINNIDSLYGQLEKAIDNK